MLNNEQDLESEIGDLFQKYINLKIEHIIKLSISEIIKATINVVKDSVKNELWNKFIVQLDCSEEGLLDVGNKIKDNYNNLIIEKNTEIVKYLSFCYRKLIEEFVSKQISAEVSDQISITTTLCPEEYIQFIQYGMEEISRLGCSIKELKQNSPLLMNFFDNFCKNENNDPVIFLKPETQEGMIKAFTLYLMNDPAQEKINKMILPLTNRLINKAILIGFEISKKNGMTFSKEVEVVIDMITKEVQNDNIFEIEPIKNQNYTNIKTKEKSEPSINSFDDKSAPIEKHFTIKHGQKGITYKSIVGEYIDNSKEIVIRDPYIRSRHQIDNFVRFCELLVTDSKINKIELNTSFEDENQKKYISDIMSDLIRSLDGYNITLTVSFNPHLHDRQIKLDNGWIIKIGRGLDIYLPPEHALAVGASSYELRPCRETDVDIFKIKS